ncbi:MAG: ABC transporter substrate-binding protein [Desulfobacteraceae bacterium]|nr:ABC transporter substrate-binding protein [Desulfobacteraceae bacterium]
MLYILFYGMIFSACTTEEKSSGQTTSYPKNIAQKAKYAGPLEKLPDGINWLTNDTDPVFASDQAKKGGTLHEFLASFPLTFRVVGPDSNTSFRSAILGNQLNLTGLHPNTLNIIPGLASHWAFGKDKRTMYFRLNPKARWSDGVTVTADDFVFTLEFMRSKHIVAPWYNDYYTQEVERVIVFDDYTLAVVSTKAQPDLHLKISLGPMPRHFFGQLDEDFIRKYNWAIVPNTGPYQIDTFKKGRYVRFERKQDWWANDLHYFKHRFNVDKVLYKVIRDTNLQWEYFKKAKLDYFPATLSQYWHIKSKTAVVEKGYVHKMQFFNDTQRSARGLWLNLNRKIFKDINVRYAFAHAINVERVIKQVLFNDYYRLENAYVGYGPYSNDTIKARRYDIRKVSDYMHGAGYKRGPDGIWVKNGRRFSVQVVYHVEEFTPRMVVYKEEARKAGIELRLAKLDPAASFKKVLEKRHDVALVGWGTSIRPHFWEFWHSVNARKGQTNNITNTADAQLDRLIDAYRDSLDEQERIRLAHQIQLKVYEIGAFVPTMMAPYFRQVYWRWWKFPDTAATKTSESLFDPFSRGLFWFDQEQNEQTKKAMRKGQTYSPVTLIDETYKP